MKRKIAFEMAAYMCGGIAVALEFSLAFSTFNPFPLAIGTLFGLMTIFFYLDLRRA